MIFSTSCTIVMLVDVFTLLLMLPESIQKDRSKFNELSVFSNFDSRSLMRIFIMAPVN